MRLEFETRLAEDGRNYEARCLQFPDVPCYVMKREAEALRGIVMFIASEIRRRLVAGEPLPEDCGVERRRRPKERKE